MKILLLAGAGTSIELGVPGMVGMAEEFRDHARQWDVEPDLVETIMQGSLDVEHLIEHLDHLCSARSSLNAIGQVAPSFERIDKIRAEVEWFVQHAAERVVARDAQLMWGSVLRSTASIDLTIVTTNYDRAIELAANAERIYLDDGYGLFGQRERAEWVGFGPDLRRPRLVKLHGSTDWYAARETGNPTKLSHPMPLFGRAALRLADGTELGSALVLPSREKLLTRDPYPRLSQAFLNAADCCQCAVIIGSSLRDHHTRGAAQTMAQRVPVFVVNPEGSTNGIPGARAIHEHASTFLISTLPQALMTDDPAAALVAAAERTIDGAGTLHAVREALDSDARTDLRCQAIDDLDGRGIVLDPYLVRQLLESADPVVARYALGLVPLSPARDALIETAERSPHRGESAFQEDLALLREMVSQTDLPQALAI